MPKNNEEMRIRLVEEKEIPISELILDTANVRMYVGDVSDLVASILQMGFTTPLMVRRLPDGKYGVICGSRRLQAAKIVGLTSVPCRVYDVDDANALGVSLLDNELVKSLTREERLTAYYRLVQLTGSLSKAAEILGKHPQSIKDAVDEYHNLKRAEKEGVLVVDRRTKEAEKIAEQAEGKTVIGKTTLRNIAKGFRRLERSFGIGGWGEVGGEPSPVSPQPDSKPGEKPRPEGAGEPGAVFKPPSIAEAVKKLWKPRLFKYKEGVPYLHELLKRDEIQLFIPENPKPDMVITRRGMMALVTSLSKPYDHITVLLCPNCEKVLRSVGKEGAPVVCQECGFPSNDVWKKVEEEEKVEEK